MGTTTGPEQTSSLEISFLPLQDCCAKCQLAVSRLVSELWSSSALFLLVKEVTIRLSTLSFFWRLIPPEQQWQSRWRVCSFDIAVHNLVY